jgi:hypothetical protein
MNYKKSIFIILATFLFQSAEADVLENLGWTKNVDDFEGTTSYVVHHQNIAWDCDKSRAAVFGLVDGETKTKTPLSIMYYFYGADDIRRKGTFKWKSDDGTKSLDLECANDYENGGYQRQCLVMGITADTADSLANTDFIRIDFPSTNIDLKEEGSTSGCETLFTDTRRLASEYSQAVN